MGRPAPHDKVRRVSVEQHGPSGAKSRKEVISSLLSRIEEQLDPKTTKVTLADFIRLIQLQRELEKEEQPAEVIVTWKDVPETQSTV